MNKRIILIFVLFSLFAGVVEAREYFSFSFNSYGDRDYYSLNYNTYDKDSRSSYRISGSDNSYRVSGNLYTLSDSGSHDLYYNYGEYNNRDFSNFRYSYNDYGRRIYRPVGVYRPQAVYRPYSYMNYWLRLI